MPLEDSVVEWLQANFRAAADHEELDRTYEFAHRFNGDRDIACADPEPLGGRPETLNWHVRFYDGVGSCLHEHDTWASRAATPSMTRWGGVGVGPVALNQFLKLKGEFQRERFGSTLYRAEEALYRSWGIREIQVEALWDGRVVWPRLGFLPKEPEAMALAFDDWQTATRWHGPVPSSFQRYPSEFLLSLECILLYKVLT